MSVSHFNPSCSGRDLALSALLLVDRGLSAQEALHQAIAEAGRAQAKAVKHGSCQSARDNTGRSSGRSSSADPGKQPAGNNIPERERALAGELLYGCLRAEARIDFLLAHVLPRPEKLPGQFLHILSLAVYSMLFQGSVPDRAAIHTAVEMAGRTFGKGLRGLANGSLRSIQRLGSDLDDPAFYARGKGPDASWHGLATYHGLPPFIADLWREAYGKDQALALMRRSAARPWTGIRVNPRHQQAGAILDELTRNITPGNGRDRTQATDQDMGRMARIGTHGLAFAPGCLPRVILGLSLDHWQAAGAISFQSAGSQLVLQELGILPGGPSGREWQSAPVWDACAGVGGKSLALLEQGIKVGLATDSSRRRLAILPRQCARLGLVSPPVALASAEQPPLRAWPGNILLDVPCSGLGVLARRPDLRRRFTGKAAGQHLRGLVRSQTAILEMAASLLEKGRQLAYITCTLDPEENTGQIKRLLARHPGLSMIREWQTGHEHPWLEGMYGALIG